MAPDEAIIFLGRRGEELRLLRGRFGLYWLRDADLLTSAHIPSGTSYAALRELLAMSGGD